jgi:hypothetical protein
MFKYLWHLPMDFLAWISFNLFVYTNGEIEWIVRFALWTNSITIETLEDIYDDVFFEYTDEDEDDEKNE